MKQWCEKRPLIGVLVGLVSGMVWTSSFGWMAALWLCSAVIAVAFFIESWRMILVSGVIGLAMSSAFSTHLAGPPQGIGVLLGKHHVRGVAEGPPRIRHEGWSLRVRLVSPVEGTVLVLGKTKLPKIGRGTQLEWTSTFKWFDPRGRPQEIMGVTKAPDVVTVRHHGPVYWKWSAELRAFAYEQGQTCLSERAFGWVAALGLGDPGLLKVPVRDRLQTMGLSHLLAVSGLHLTLVLGWVWLGFRRLRFSRSPPWNALLRAAVCLGVLMGYLLLTPQNDSTVRAFIFAVVFLVATVSKERIDGPSMIALAMIIFLCIDPDAWRDAGTQLSFCGVISLMVAHKRLKSEERGRIQDGSALSLRHRIYLGLIAPWVGTMPLVVYWFDGFALGAPLANAIAIPLTGLFILPLFLVVTGGLLLGISYVQMSLALDEITGVLEALIVLMEEQIGWFVPAQAQGVMTVLMLLVALGALGGAARRGRVACMVALCVAYGVPEPMKSKEKWSVSFINVGHGDATVLCGPQSTLVIDAGKESDGWFRVLRKIRARGCVENIHLLVSHGDADHAGGMLPLIERLPIRSLMLGNSNDTSPAMIQLLTLASMKKVPVVMLKRGEARKLGDSGVMEVLGPSAHLMNQPLSSNDSSLVLLIRLWEHRLLFTGDIEAKGEADLLESKAVVSPTVLKVAHHGSRTSSSDSFLRWVKPIKAVVSGDQNRGHPHSEVLQRLQHTVPSLWMTAGLDEVVMSFWSDGLHVETPAQWVRRTPLSRGEPPVLPYSLSPRLPQ